MSNTPDLTAMVTERAEAFKQAQVTAARLEDELKRRRRNGATLDGLAKLTGLDRSEVAWLTYDGKRKPHGVITAPSQPRLVA